MTPLQRHGRDSRGLSRSLRWLSNRAKERHRLFYIDGIERSGNRIRQTPTGTRRRHMQGRAASESSEIARSQHTVQNGELWIQKKPARVRDSPMKSTEVKAVSIADMWCGRCSSRVASRFVCETNSTVMLTETRAPPMEALWLPSTNETISSRSPGVGGLIHHIWRRERYSKSQEASVMRNASGCPRSFCAFPTNAITSGVISTTARRVHPAGIVPFWSATRRSIGRLRARSCRSRILQ